jgi:hypothetical protein
VPLDSGDFVIVENLRASAANPDTGSVIIRRLSNHVEHIYPTGAGSLWMIEFCDDLTNGPFL